MGNRDLRIIFEKAQEGDQEAIERILKLFEPLIYKHSIENGVFNEDCFQELNIKLIKCIQSFKFEPNEEIQKCREEIYSIISR
ncbi:helix-turn-helix domain-containing protein [Alkaliphilus transvaalensis]|uniref:helix-turn-helix domain-containing protein n=1 Tax=Alkaliphilus transvaalensis TaxID=114628 RepID=UPI00047C0E22|nr:helix-turn-helix domain-containing protein [Alkaliphilus transvaalensis]